MQFLAVYIREAHALDSVLAERHDGRWLGGSPERDLFIEDPITLAERRTLAQRCEREMQLGCPMLVDGLDDSVNLGYAAWPERLYLVDVDGTLIYRGDRGPNGFMPDELETELERCSEAWSTGATAGSAPQLAKTQPDESALWSLLER